MSKGLLRPQSAAESGGKTAGPPSAAVALAATFTHSANLAPRARGGRKRSVRRSQRRPFKPPKAPARLPRIAGRSGRDKGPWRASPAEGRVVRAGRLLGLAHQRQHPVMLSRGPGNCAPAINRQQARRFRGMPPGAARRWSRDRRPPPPRERPRIASISLSVIAGKHRADQHCHRHPRKGGQTTAGIVSSRRGGVAATRFQHARRIRSSAVNQTCKTFASPCAAIGARMSQVAQGPATTWSRCRPGGGNRAATRSMSAVSFSCRFHRLVGIGVWRHSANGRYPTAHSPWPAVSRSSSSRGNRACRNSRSRKSRPADRPQ